MNSDNEIIEYDLSKNAYLYFDVKHQSMKLIGDFAASYGWDVSLTKEELIKLRDFLNELLKQG